MNRFLKISILLLVFLLINGCNQSHSTTKGESSSSWAYEKMISLNGINYIVLSENTKKVDKEIGKINHYSTNESDFNKENFSNYFKVGTKIYSIPNINTKDAVAVEVEKNQFYKAVNEDLLNK